MTELVLASHNAGKRAEMRVLLAGHGFSLLDPEQVSLPEPEEIGESFEAIARDKALHAARVTGRAAIADDTGLCVDALGGGPGLHTKGWAMERGGWEAARLALVTQLGLLEGGGPEVRLGSRVNFACGVAWAEPEGACWHGFARVYGRLRWPERGEGPGFVRIFEPDEPGFWRGGVFAHRRLAFERMWATRAAALLGADPG